MGEGLASRATLSRADVSWGAIVYARADAVMAEMDEPSLPGLTHAKQDNKVQRLCRTDSEASPGKGGRTSRAEPAYKQRTPVDAACGVLLDVEVKTGRIHDSNAMSALETVPRITGRPI